MQIQKNAALKDLLWYKIGGTAKYLIDVSSKEDLVQAIDFLQTEKIQNIFILGLGSNLLFAKGYFDGAVIHFVPSNVILGSAATPGSLQAINANVRDSGALRPALTQQDEQAQDAARMTGNGIRVINDTQIEALAGETLDSVIQFAFQHNLVGLEWAGGLPGTVGAAVRGNVGAFGGEIKDVIVSAEVIDIKNGEVRTLSNEALAFAYRSSLVKQQKRLVVIAATFRLNKATDAELAQAKDVYQQNIKYREKRHPLDYPTCGSVFKNIKKQEEVKNILARFPEMKELVETKWHGKVSMAYLIGTLGFSGFRVGNAQVSEKHNNFIMNLGDASASDVLQIIKAIQEKCQQIVGFTPEVEVEII